MNVLLGSRVILRAFRETRSEPGFVTCLNGRIRRSDSDFVSLSTKVQLDRTDGDGDSSAGVCG